MNETPTASGLGARLTGRFFIHPLVDYMLIGGGLSLIVTVIVALTPAMQSVGYLTITENPYTFVAYLILFCNSTHFAASTVRLYSKPGAFQSLPFLTMVFPVVAIGILTLFIAFPGPLAPHLQSLYVTWSPFHYAAQAYGIAVVYSYRGGCVLAKSDKKLLWWVSMLPFFYNFLIAPNIGLHWIVPEAYLKFEPVAIAIKRLGTLLLVMGLVCPLLLYAKVWAGRSGPMPFISLLAVVTNGVWFFVLNPLHAFVWATIFHGVQYLAIVLIFHLKDQKALPNNRRSGLYHVVRFYVVSLLFAYGLFHCFPLAYQFVGFKPVESVLMVVAAINIHHFIVDAYIWRLKKSDSNRRIVESHQPPLA